MNSKGSETIVAYKGMDKNMQCRGFQFEVGKEYETDGIIIACENGFHACESPLDVIAYYPPSKSRYFEVEQSGDFDRDNRDTKVASKKIKIGAEIGISGLIKAHFEYVKKHITNEHTDPDQATAGNRGAATAGDYGAATSRGSASIGANGIACVRGNGIKAKGGIGAVLLIAVENENDFDLKEWKAVVVDGEKIKADTWYTLVDGNLIKVDGVQNNVD